MCKKRKGKKRDENTLGCMVEKSEQLNSFPKEAGKMKMALHRDSGTLEPRMHTLLPNV